MVELTFRISIDISEPLYSKDGEYYYEIIEQSRKMGTTPEGLMIQRAIDCNSELRRANQNPAIWAILLHEYRLSVEMTDDARAIAVFLRQET